MSGTIKVFDFEVINQAEGRVYVQLPTTLERPLKLLEIDPFIEQLKDDLDAVAANAKRKLNEIPRGSLFEGR